jgi:F420-non-reducing hydrogenase large subunit
MSRTIAIDPVTRIEGHAKVFLDLGSDGSLSSAGLIVNELRGFERILVGVEADRVPLITARICGVCPTAHHLAASKALDAACGVTVPPAAALLRELLFMGHFLHSHALSLFVLQGPDLVMGLDGAPATRNVVGVVDSAPDVARKALRCRTIGQKINELVGGRGVHPVTVVAGGISFRLDAERRRILSAWLDEALQLAAELAGVARDLLLRQIEKHPAILGDWVVPAWSVGTVRGGALNLYDGLVRVMDETGAKRAEFPASTYDTAIVESSLPFSYMKPVRLACDGAEHLYRVGPLARLNAADTLGTPLADRELLAFRQAHGRPCHATVLQAYARAIELLYAAERGRQILDDRDISGETRVPVRFRGGRGVGHVEAPRGTLFHDYEIDERGIVRAANLVVATQQNYDAINRSIEQAARSHVLGRGDAGLLNAVEFAIRCYDPCLSCATHAVGRMPLDLVVRRGGKVVDRIRRDANGPR